MSGLPRLPATEMICDPLMWELPSGPTHLLNKDSTSNIATERHSMSRMIVNS
jgi:hypothetical protein